jgi:hypothetical protein
MPKVNGVSYPYTEQGMEDAKKAKEKKKKKKRKAPLSQGY